MNNDKNNNKTPVLIKNQEKDIQQARNIPLGATTNFFHQTARAWAITINNYTLDDKNAFKSFKLRNTLCGIAGLELGAQSQTPHIQGYLRFKTPTRGSTLHKLLPRAHLEPAKGSPQANFDYCTKERDILIQWGKFGPKGLGKGTRTDYTKAFTMDDEEITKAWPFYAERLIQARNRIIDFNAPDFNPRRIILLLHGPTSSGKTTLATKILQECSLAAGQKGKYDKIAFTKNNQLQGYSGINKFALLDEVTYDPYVPHLKLLDRFNHPFDVKYSRAMPNYDLIILTAPRSVDTMDIDTQGYQDDNPRDHLARRVHIQVEITRNTDFTQVKADIDAEIDLMWSGQLSKREQFYKLKFQNKF